MKDRHGGETRGAAGWIARLHVPATVNDLSPIAQRFIFRLRVVAVYRKAGRDPLAELTSRVGSITVAVKSLQLFESMAHVWPKPVHVQRCCCQILSHDELTIARALEAIAENNVDGFDAQLADLMPSDTRKTIANAAGELIVAEFG